VLSGYKAYYNSVRGGRRAGTITLVHRSILEHYTIHHHIIMEGYLSVTLCTPKDSQQHKPFSVYNIYIYTGSTSKDQSPEMWNQHVAELKASGYADTETRRQAYQLRLLAAYEDNTRFQFWMGDWNFVMTPSDRASNRDSDTMVVVAMEALIKGKGLREAHQPSHTFCRVSAPDMHKLQFNQEGNVDKQSLVSSRLTAATSRLDRVYTTFTEAEFALVQVQAQIAKIPFDMFSTYTNWARAKMESSKGKRVEFTYIDKEGQRRLTPLHPSDHLPVVTSFTPVDKETSQTSQQRIYRPPEWIFDTPDFTARFEKEWGTVKQPNNAFANLELFKIVVRRVAKTYFTKPYTGGEKKVFSHPMEQLTAAIRLYRYLMTPGPSDRQTADIQTMLLKFPMLAKMAPGLQPSQHVVNKLAGHINKLVRQHCTNIDNDHTDKDGQDNDAPQDTNRASNHLKQLSRTLPSGRVKLTRLKEVEDEEATDDPDLMTNMAAGFWSKVWAHRDYDAHSAAAFLALYKKRIGKQPAVMTVEAVVAAIKSTNNSAPGPDGIPFRAYRLLALMVAPILHGIAMAMSRGKKPPRGFNHADLYLLPKDNSMLVDKTRPISVPNTSNRIVSTVLLVSITPVITPLLNKAQAAMPGGNIGENIQNFNERFYGAQQRKGKYYLFLLDFQKAYDSMQHQYVLAVLRAIGMPEWVLNMVVGLLSELAATTTFPGAHPIDILISRGVKQGCPLSPLLFMLIMDPLLTILTDPPEAIKSVYPVHDVEVGGFVDDVGAGAEDIRVIDFIAAMVEMHNHASGLNIHQGKSIILTTKPVTESDRAVVKESIWPDMRFPEGESGYYLGVLFGRTVTLDQIYSRAVTKFVNRVNTYFAADIKEYAMITRITIANVFLLPIFSYLNQFFQMPVGARKIVYHQLRRLLIPYSAFSIQLLMYPPQVGMIKRPLDHFEIRNDVMLARKRTVDMDRLVGVHTTEHIESLKTHGRGKKLKRAFPATTHSLRMTHHFVQAFHYCRDDHHEHGYGITINPDLSVATNYAEMFQSKHALHHGHWAIAVKIKKLQATTVTHLQLQTTNPRAFALPATDEGLLDAATHRLENVSRLGPRVHDALRMVTARFAYKALSTGDRLRVLHRPGHALAPSLGPNQSCFLCGGHKDELSHIFYQCTCVEEAWRQLKQRFLTNGPAFQNVDISHWLLIRQTMNTREVHFIVFFLHATWKARGLARTNDGLPNGPQAIIDIFTHNAYTMYPALVHKHVATRQPSAKKKLAAAAVTKLAAARVDSKFYAFTDGSSNPNPGPCGAGVMGYWKDQTFKHYASLGHGSNNIGELYAAGMALDLFKKLFNQHLFTNQVTTLVILTDSLYVYGLMTQNHKAKKNTRLVRALRDKLRHFPVRVEWVWCPGHMGVAGNELADEEAGKGTDDSEVGEGIEWDERLRLHYHDFTVPVSRLHHSYPP
jgi:ribonuclease HI